MFLDPIIHFLEFIMCIIFLFSDQCPKKPLTKYLTSEFLYTEYISGIILSFNLIELLIILLEDIAVMPITAVL